MANISIERGGSDSELGEMDDTSLSFSQYMPDKKRKGRKQQIIVKFSNYKIKSKVFASKTKLKGHSDRTFITEVKPD